MEGVERRGAATGFLPEALHLVHQHLNRVVPVAQGSFKLLAPLLEGLDFLPLALTRRLGGTTVSENTLYTSLLLLVVGLGSLSIAGVRTL